MARSAQYSRGRRIVMQATLFVVLLATLGLAALLGQSRERSSAVGLAAEPVRMGRLEVRPPANWFLQPEVSAEGTITSTLVAWESPGGVFGGRVLTIAQASQPGGQAPDQFLRKYLAKHLATSGSVRQITFRGQSAVLARVEGEFAVPNDPFGRSIELPGWAVAMIVPSEGDDGQDLGVVVRLDGAGAAGPAGSRLVRQVADALAVTSPAAASTREITGK